MHSNVLVIHASGAYSYARRARAQAVVDDQRGYWKNDKQQVLIMCRKEDIPDAPANGYEYTGAFSYAPRAYALACDRRTRTVIKVPIQEIDRTKTPVNTAGGAKVMQLQPMVNRHSTGNATTRRDSLWHPPLKKKAKRVIQK